MPDDLTNAPLVPPSPETARTPRLHALGRARIRTALTVIAFVSLLAVALVIGRAPSAGVEYSGVVIDIDGRPLSGARVTIADAESVSGVDGSFRVVAGPLTGWIRADAAGHLPRVRTARGGDPVVLRLTPDDGDTVSLVFGGDVMAGRRFFDQNEDGDRSDRILDLDADASAHARLLDGVQAVLDAADLAVVNLETPLIAEPWIDPTRPRPSAFHPTKEFAFASGPALAEGLRQAGVDLVGLGNNHLNDALAAGVEATLVTLDRSGFRQGTGRFGGGRTESEAWEPAVREVGGQRIAFLGCTTISGEEHEVLYVATPTTPGAALCDEESITRHVRAAADAADVVVFSLHGGFEYVREPSDRVTALSHAAREAGATLVINHHPHVVGGVAADDSSLIAWTLGNLLFDQTVWPTFPSYLLSVHVRDGRPVRAIADPILLDEYRPVGLVGEASERVARLAAARSKGSIVIEDGVLEIGLAPAVTHASAPNGAGPTINRVPSGWRPALGVTGEVGRDLLFMGGFEDEDVDLETEDADLWLPTDRDRLYATDQDAQGSVFARLTRDAANDSPVLLAPAHRVPVGPGRPLSLIARVRSPDVTSLELQVSWYNDLLGASQAQSVVAITVGPAWREIRVDLVTPDNVVAVQPFFRLHPPEMGRVVADVDDISLIEWLPASEASAETTYVRGASATVALVAHSLPGGPGVGDPTLDVVAGGPDARLSVDPLPPGPDAPPGE